MAMYVLSDIHGYLDALKASLAVPIAINEAAKEDPAIEPIDLIVVLGDIIGYGPEQLECIELLVQLQEAWASAHKDDNPYIWTPSKPPIATDIASQFSLIEEIITAASPELLKEDFLKKKYEPIQTIVIAGNHDRGADKNIVDGLRLDVGAFSKRAAPTLDKVLARAFVNYLNNDRKTWNQLVTEQAAGQEGIDERVAQLVFQKYARRMRQRGFKKAELETASPGSEKEEPTTTTTDFSEYAEKAITALTVQGLIGKYDQDYKDRLRGVRAFGWLRKVVQMSKERGYHLDLQGHGYKVRVSHTHPVDSVGYVKTRDDMKKVLQDLSEKVRVHYIGHTHHFGWFPEDDDEAKAPEVNGNVCMNVGSTGDPRKHANGMVYPATAAIGYTHLPPQSGIKPIQKRYDANRTIRMLEQSGMDIPNELKELGRNQSIVQEQERKLKERHEAG